MKIFIFDWVEDVANKNCFGKVFYRKCHCNLTPVDLLQLFNKGQNFGLFQIKSISRQQNKYEI